MTWNIRLVKSNTEFGEYYELREVYYNEMGKPCGHIKLHAFGDSRRDLLKYIELIQEATTLPALTFEDWSHANPTQDNQVR